MQQLNPYFNLIMIIIMTIFSIVLIYLTIVFKKYVKNYTNSKKYNESDDELVTPDRHIIMIDDNMLLDLDEVLQVKKIKNANGNPSIKIKYRGGGSDILDSDILYNDSFENDDVDKDRIIGDIIHRLTTWKIIRSRYIDRKNTSSPMKCMPLSLYKMAFKNHNIEAF